MLTILIGGATFGACALLRVYLKGRTPSGGTWVRIQSLWNCQGAFDVPVDRRLLAGLSGLTLVLVWQSRRRSPIGAGLLLGGGLSNLWERLRCGAVLDYLRFTSAPGPLKRYVYNLADFAVFAGALLLLRKRR